MAQPPDRCLGSGMPVKVVVTWQYRPSRAFLVAAAIPMFFKFLCDFPCSGFAQRPAVGQAREITVAVDILLKAQRPQAKVRRIGADHKGRASVVVITADSSLIHS